MSFFSAVLNFFSLILLSWSTRSVKTCWRILNLKDIATKKRNNIQCRFRSGEAWKLVICHVNHKISTTVFCIQIRNFESSVSFDGEIYAIFQYVNMLCTTCDVIVISLEYLISLELAEIYRVYWNKTIIWVAKKLFHKQIKLPASDRDHVSSKFHEYTI